MGQIDLWLLLLLDWNDFNCMTVHANDYYHLISIIIIFTFEWSTGGKIYILALPYQSTPSFIEICHA